MRDNLIRAFRKGEYGTDMTDAQVEMVIDEMLHFVDKAGYRLITKMRYEEWKNDVKILARLETYGVDNWEGWDEAVRSLEPDESA